MLNQNEEFPISVVRSGVDFLSSLGEFYGNERALQIWDSIRSSIGEDLAGAIFMAMLTGNVTRRVTIRSLAPGETLKIEAIKQVREVTGMGLKEAKDLVAACDLGPQQFTLRDSVNLNEFVRNMNRAGFGVR
jgi:hypothetical protein